MLLTASQVSALISGGIIILFTSALFLSGFVLQQRTIGKLRTAVRAEMRPRPSPRQSDYRHQRNGGGSIPEGMGHLPDRFRKETMEMEDGSVVELTAKDLEDIGEGRVGVVINRHSKEGGGVKEDIMGGGEGLEVRRSESSGEENKKGMREMKMRKGGQGKGEEEISLDLDTAAAAAGMGADVEVGGGMEKLSRAERRRRIKADIHELAQAKEPVYYQRRLW